MRKGLRYYYWWLGIGLFAIVLTYGLCLVPVQIDASEGGPHLDKLVHFTIYFLHVYYFGELFEDRWHWLLIPLFFCMGVSIECLQSYQPTRAFEGLDIVANSLGILMAKICLVRRQGCLLFKLEKFLSS